ncbi:MAG: hypothetical protein E7638_07510, partial [Ruminococcaceae bacterium]|nr:hypothetical protein [Oscillospiraceae bacterium]
MSRWNIKTPKKSIEWTLKPGDIHSEDLEMAGFGVSDTVKYGVDENGFFLIHHPVFPTLRKHNNNTHGSYQLDIEPQFMPSILAGGSPVREELKKVTIDGTLTLETEADGLAITHRCFPSTELRASYELVSVTNNGKKAVTLSFTTPEEVFVHEEMGAMGICITEVFHDAEKVTLEEGETYIYGIAITGRLANEEPEFDDPKTELDNRYRNIVRLTDPMKIDTGNDVLDTMFTFAKLRGGESVFDTMGGLMHSPGGYSY